MIIAGVSFPTSAPLSSSFSVLYCPVPCSEAVVAARDDIVDARLHVDGTATVTLIQRIRCPMFQSVVDADNARTGVGRGEADMAEEVKEMNSMARILMGRFDAMEAQSMEPGGQETTVGFGCDSGATP